MAQEHPMACEPMRLNHAAPRAHARARQPVASTFNPKVAGSIAAGPFQKAQTRSSLDLHNAVHARGGNENGNVRPFAVHPCRLWSGRVARRSRNGCDGRVALRSGMRSQRAGAADCLRVTDDGRIDLPCGRLGVVQMRRGRGGVR